MAFTDYKSIRITFDTEEVIAGWLSRILAGGVWEVISDMKILVGGAWKTVSQFYVLVDDVWKEGD